jgi:hypothetical protein
MTSMNRVRVSWSGWVGQPGLTTFYMSDSTLDVTPIKNFFTALAGKVPTPITWTIPALGDKIDDKQGDLVGAWAGTGGGVVAASGTGSAFAGAAGFLVDWKTSTIHRGRRIQGRSYFVPSATSVYQSDGTIFESDRAAIAAAGQALVTAMTPNLLIWARPFPGKAAEVGPPAKPAKPAADGASGPIVLAVCPDINAVLRSRRA